MACNPKTQGSTQPSSVRHSEELTHTLRVTAHFQISYSHMGNWTAICNAARDVSGSQSRALGFASFELVEGCFGMRWGPGCSAFVGRRSLVKGFRFGVLVVAKVRLCPRSRLVPVRASGWAPEFHSLTHSLTHSLRVC